MRNRLKTDKRPTFEANAVAIRHYHFRSILVAIPTILPAVDLSVHKGRVAFAN